MLSKLAVPVSVRKRVRSLQIPAAILAVFIAVLTSQQGLLRAEPAAVPRLDWMFDGIVSATARVGNVLYAGGFFKAVAPTSSALGYLVSVSTTTGAADPNFTPANSRITALEPDGSGGYFLAQLADASLSVLPATRVVHVRADGSVDPTFASLLSGTVSRLARVGPSLVVSTGLNLSGVNGPLLALDVVSGALSGWAPALPGGRPGLIGYPLVVDMEVANGRLYVLSMPFYDSNGRHVSAFDGTTGALLWVVEVVPETVRYPNDGNGALAIGAGRLIVATDRGIQSLSLATGAIDPNWGGSLTGVTVRDVAVGPATVFVGGRFTQFMGAPRSNLAALDLATGALTAFNPPPSLTVDQLVASPSGTVYASLLRTGVGQATRHLVELDATGAQTPWVTPYVGTPFDLSPSGNLLVGTGLALPGTPRVNFAAFDTTTGALLPEALVIAGGTVSSLVSIGTTLYLAGDFTSVNGVARQFGAAVDTATNTVLPWTLPAGQRLRFAHGGFIYTTSGQQGRRLSATTGDVDVAWRPPPVWDLTLDGNVLVAAVRLQPEGNAVGTLDSTTGQFTEMFRTTSVGTLTGGLSGLGSGLAVMGQTVYLAGWVPGADRVAGRDLADTVMAFDRTTGVPVAPAVRGFINGVAVADGRVIPYGGRLVMNGDERAEVAEVSRNGRFTAWNAGWPWRNAPLFFGYLGEANFPRGVLGVSVAGDLLVVRGKSDGTGGTERLTAYPLSGNSVPANLRSQVVGPNTVFSWDPMAVPPPSGYVIEGGFAPGQAAAALAVGNATSVALPMPAGPVYLRVRAHSSTDTSNEIVAGCFAPPLPPTALTAAINGTNLTLTWTPPSGEVTTYTVVAGSTTGGSDVATLSLSGAQTSIAGPVAGGTFFVRALASNACGASGPSGEVFFTMGAPDLLPAAPTNLAATVTGQTVSLSWTGPSAPVTGYVVEAGTAPGLANLGALRLGPGSSLVLPGVPSGSYALRVRAVTSAGSGAPSADVIVVVP